MSACSASRCELTDTYSPAAIDIDPAKRPATPATRTASFEAEDAATPIIRLEIETIASSEPSTAARNHPARPLRCISAIAFSSVTCRRRVDEPRRQGDVPIPQLLDVQFHRFTAYADVREA